MLFCLIVCLTLLASFFLFSASLINMYILILADVRTADRPMMELQKQLSDYRGTLTGKKLLKSGVLRKCTRRGALDDRMIYLVSR